MSLEPSAFGGRLPAQVRFSIHRRCDPVPESTFKSIIEDNYQGGAEFKPELSCKQVRRLVPLLRWCTERTPPSVAPYPHLGMPCHPSDPCFVDVSSKIEPPRPPSVKPPFPVDPSKFRYSHNIDIVPRVEPPLTHLRRPTPPAVNTYPSQFLYSHPIDIVPKVDPPLSHLVRPLQYSYLVDVMPAHPSDQHYVIENQNQFWHGDSTQLVQDRYTRNSSFPLPGECEDEDKRSESDDSSFEDLTPEHDNRFEDLTPEHDNQFEDLTPEHDNGISGDPEKVDKELDRKDVSPKCDIMRSLDSNNVIHAAQSMTRFRGLQERESELLEATVAKYLNPYQTPNSTYPPNVTSYPSYHSTTYPCAHTYIYPHQSVGSARVEPPTSNVPISSLFSFSGPSK